MDDLAIIRRRMLAVSETIENKHAALSIKLASHYDNILRGIHRLTDDERLLEFRDHIVDNMSMFENRGCPGDKDVADAYRLCLPIFDDFIKED